MKRIPQRAKLPPPEPIIINLDPGELRAGIVLPTIKYQVIASVATEEVFNGMVLPIPKVLIYFLNHNEMMIVSMILEECSSTGECVLTVKELATKIKISLPTLSNCLHSLRKVGLLLESPNGKRGAGRIRKLNYKAIQHLNDLVEGEDPGIYARIRKAVRKINIMNITKNDVKGAYDHLVLEPGHDPAEEEEYN